MEVLLLGGALAETQVGVAELVLPAGPADGRVLRRAAAVRELASSVPIDIVPIPPELIEKTHGAFTPITVPANTYTGQTAAVPTAALNNFLVTHSEVPEGLVYEMVKQFYAHLPEIQASSLAARSISRDKALVSRPVALHPGAARYFREIGLLK